MTTSLRIPTEILDIEVAELLKATPGLQTITELREISDTRATNNYRATGDKSPLS